MTTAVSKFTTDVVSIDSFLFQRRGFLRKRSGFYWEYHLTRKDILTGLDFRLEREPDGSTALRFSHATNIDDGESTPAIYSVSIESTPCRHGARWSGFRHALLDQRQLAHFQSQLSVRTFAACSW